MEREILSILKRMDGRLGNLEQEFYSFVDYNKDGENPDPVPVEVEPVEVPTVPPEGMDYSEEPKTEMAPDEMATDIEDMDIETTPDATVEVIVKPEGTIAPDDEELPKEPLHDMDDDDEQLASGEPEDADFGFGDEEGDPVGDDLPNLNDVDDEDNDDGLPEVGDENPMSSPSVDDDKKDDTDANETLSSDDESDAEAEVDDKEETDDVSVDNEDGDDGDDVSVDDKDETDDVSVDDEDNDSEVDDKEETDDDKEEDDKEETDDDEEDVEEEEYGYGVPKKATKVKLADVNEEEKEEKCKDCDKTPCKCEK